MQMYPGGGIKKFSKIVEEEYSVKGGDRCASPPNHSTYVHKESYEGYGGGYPKHGGHDGFKAHSESSWFEKEKHHDHHHHGGGYGGNHGGYGGNHGAGYGGNHGGGYGHHYESYKSMGGGPQMGAPLWNFKGVSD